MNVKELNNFSLEILSRVLVSLLWFSQPKRISVFNLLCVSSIKPLYTLHLPSIPALISLYLLKWIEWCSLCLSKMTMIAFSIFRIFLSITHLKRMHAALLVVFSTQNFRESLNWSMIYRENDKNLIESVDLF